MFQPRPPAPSQLQLPKHVVTLLSKPRGDRGTAGINTTGWQVNLFNTIGGTNNSIQLVAAVGFVLPSDELSRFIFLHRLYHHHMHRSASVSDSPHTPLPRPSRVLLYALQSLPSSPFCSSIYSSEYKPPRPVRRPRSYSSLPVVCSYLHFILGVPSSLSTHQKGVYSLH